MARQQHIKEMETRRLRLTDDIERLLARARGATDEMKMQAKAAATRAKEDVKVAVRDLTHDARDVATRARSDTADMAKEKVRDFGHAAVDYPREKVTEQPVLGLLAGVGVGFAAAMLVLPKRRKVHYTVATDVQ